MKQRTKYECEYCGALYDLGEDANMCENSHCKGVKIKKETYIQGFKFPCTVLIEFDNGRCKEYRFNEPELI